MSLTTFCGYLQIFSTFFYSHRFNSDYLLLFQITGKLSTVSRKAVWRVKEKDKEFAENLLCSKRLDMDDALCKMAKIQFFFSSVTGVTRHKKGKRSTECEELSEGKDAELEQQDSNSLINETSETEKSSQSSCHANSLEAILEEPDFYPAMAYFVAFTEIEDCSANKIFQVSQESEAICSSSANSFEVKEAQYKPSSQRSF